MITCDKMDEIIPVQGSVMVCVARAAAEQQQQITNHYTNQPLGILSDAESSELIAVLDRLQKIEHCLYEFLRVRSDTELELEAEGLRQENEEFEKRNRRTMSMKEFQPLGWAGQAQTNDGV